MTSGSGYDVILTSKRGSSCLVIRHYYSPHSLKRRQLEIIGASVKQLKGDCRSREEVRMAQVLEETKARWISVGMLREEDAHFLQSVDEPYHPNIEKAR